MSNLLTAKDIELMQKYSDENGLTAHGFMRTAPHARVLYFSMNNKRTDDEEQLLAIAKKEVESLNNEAARLWEALANSTRSV